MRSQTLFTNRAAGTVVADLLDAMGFSIGRESVPRVLRAAELLEIGRSLPKVEPTRTGLVTPFEGAEFGVTCLVDRGRGHASRAPTRSRLPLSPFQWRQRSFIQGRFACRLHEFSSVGDTPLPVRSGGGG